MYNADKRQIYLLASNRLLLFLFWLSNSFWPLYVCASAQTYIVSDRFLSQIVPVFARCTFAYQDEIGEPKGVLLEMSAPICVSRAHEQFCVQTVQFTCLHNYGIGPFERCKVLGLPGMFGLVSLVPPAGKSFQVLLLLVPSFSSKTVIDLARFLAHTHALSNVNGGQLFFIICLAGSTQWLVVDYGSDLTNLCVGISISVRPILCHQTILNSTVSVQLWDHTFFFDHSL